MTTALLFAVALVGADEDAGFKPGDEVFVYKMVRSTGLPGEIVAHFDEGQYRLAERAAKRNDPDFIVEQVIDKKAVFVNSGGVYTVIRPIPPSKVDDVEISGGFQLVRIGDKQPRGPLIVPDRHVRRFRSIEGFRRARNAGDEVGYAREIMTSDESIYVAYESIISDSAMKIRRFDLTDDVSGSLVFNDAYPALKALARTVEMDLSDVINIPDFVSDSAIAKVKQDRQTRFAAVRKTVDPPNKLAMAKALESTNRAAAIDAYRRVVADYPDSPESKKAAERIRTLEKPPAKKAG